MADIKIGDWVTLPNWASYYEVVLVNPHMIEVRSNIDPTKIYSYDTSNNFIIKEHTPSKIKPKSGFGKFINRIDTKELNDV